MCQEKILFLREKNPILCKEKKSFNKDLLVQDLIPLHEEFYPLA